MNDPPVAADDVEQRPLITLCFRRRTLWIALSVPFLVISILVAAFLYQLYQSARLNAAIEARGGYTYTQYYSGRLPLAWQSWIANPDDGMQTDVYLDNCNVTDKWLARHDLSRLSGPLTISLKDNPLSDEALRHLARYRRVRFLQLSGTQITDDGLAFVRDSESLNGLMLDDTAITDDGLANLDGMPKLQMLHVHETQITDAGVLHTLQAHEISSLALDASQLTPEVVTALGNDAVYQVTLHGDNTPDVLPLLVNATGLQHLSLIGDTVTDECVPDLSQLTGLKYLHLTNMRLTRDGYDQLQVALPGCQMYVSLYQYDEEVE